MRNKKLKKLKKSLETLYYNINNQRLYIAPHCLFNKVNDFRADIYATTKKGDPWGEESIYLFGIMTLNCFEGSEIRPAKNNFKDYELVKTQNYIDIAHTPLYLNRVFTLKKFGNITKKDIKGCAKYFMNEILDAEFWCWNIEAMVEYEKRRTKCK